jgi:hypothetical protein
MTQSYWFLQNEEWHAYAPGGPVALCGQTSIFYGRDPIADAVPSGGKVHKACLSAIDKVEKAEAKSLKNNTHKKTVSK